MPDVKDCPKELVEAFTESIGRTLRKYDLMEHALFIGNRKIGREFQGEARVSWRGDLDRLRRSDWVKEDITKEFFIFGHAADFTRENVRAFQEAGLEVIVSINKDPESPMMKLATFAVEGDLFELLPAIQKELEAQGVAVSAN